MKISPTISQPSNNRTVNSISIPLVSPKDGKENTRATNVHGNLKNETPIKNGGTLSIFKSNNNKGKTKSNHDIRNVVLPLVALWIVLGGIYATWTYFGKNSEPTNQETAAVDSVNKKISFYIADISSSQHGEVVSDSLKRNVYDKFYKEYHITFELSALINGSQAKVELLKNDTVHYDVNVGGVPDDSLNVNLIVKWTGEGMQESILEIPKTYNLSELKEGEEKIAILLPVAFSELKIYDEVKHLDRKNSKMLAKIMAVERKSEDLYNALRAAYDKKSDEVLVENVEQHEANEEVKLKDSEALKIIQRGNVVSELNKYDWGRGHRELAEDWNSAIAGFNNMKWVKKNVASIDWSTLQSFIGEINDKKKKK